MTSKEQITAAADAWRGKVNFLAGQFADVVHDSTTPEQFDEIKRRNRELYADSEVCATHDFFDANELMERAFRQSFGRSPWMPSDVEEGKCTEQDADADLEVWNEAWAIAKKGWLS